MCRAMGRTQKQQKPVPLRHPREERRQAKRGDMDSGGISVGRECRRAAPVPASHAFQLPSVDLEG